MSTATRFAKLLRLRIADTERTLAGLRAELARTLPRLPSLSEQEKKTLEMMLSATASKMLHDPLTYLKSESCGGRDTSEAKIDIVRTVFGLGEDGE